METDELTIKLEKELEILVNLKKHINFGKNKFGFVSKYNSYYPSLYNQLVAFANKYVYAKWNAVKVLYQNSESDNKYHFFKGKGFATVVSLGDYNNGNLQINGLTYDCKYIPFLFELNEFTLESISLGYRYFIIFYNI